MRYSADSMTLSVILVPAPEDPMSIVTGFRGACIEAGIDPRQTWMRVEADLDMLAVEIRPVTQEEAQVLDQAWDDYCELGRIRSARELAQDAGVCISCGSHPRRVADMLCYDCHHAVEYHGASVADAYRVMCDCGETDARIERARLEHQDAEHQGAACPDDCFWCY